MDADSIKIECEEDGFWLEVPTGTPFGKPFRFHIQDPEALYDHVRAAIEPWLMEREQARRVPSPEEMREWPPISISDPKHPDYHSVHADLYDNREGK